MPIYEYVCSNCAVQHSHFSRGDDASEPEDCPACRSGRLVRVPSAFAVHRSLQSRIDQIDPRIEKQLDAVDSQRTPY